MLCPPELFLLRDEPKVMSTVLWIGMFSPQTDHQVAFSPDHLTLETWGHEFPAVLHSRLQIVLLDQDPCRTVWAWI